MRPLLSSVEGLELAAVMERTSNKAAERYPGIKVYRSLEEMLADASLGLVRRRHARMAPTTHSPKQILSAGKNVVVDKPMTLTSAEAAELIGLAKKHKVLLAPFHNRRWDSDFLTVQKLLHEGSLGRLGALESRFDRWRPAPPTERLWKENADLGGGTLLDLGPHLADQALAFLASLRRSAPKCCAKEMAPGRQRLVHHPLALSGSDRHCSAPTVSRCPPRRAFTCAGRRAAT